MASLQSTSVSGTLNVGGQMVQGSNSDITPWYKIYTSVDSNFYLHVRTPLPADTSYLGWNPSILEVYGVMGNNGNALYDFKALVNVNGYNNDWYGSQIKMNKSYSGSTPVVYRSSSTYGGVTRVCYYVEISGTAGEKITMYTRWWNNSSAWNHYAWAYTTSTSTGVY